MSKGTTRRAVRVDDDLWGSALVVAAERDENLSDIIRAALLAYIEQWGANEDLFDRTVCPPPCNTMHAFSSGVRIDGCAHE